MYVEERLPSNHTQLYAFVCLFATHGTTARFSSDAQARMCSIYLMRLRCCAAPCCTACDTYVFPRRDRVPPVRRLRDAKAHAASLPRLPPTICA